MKDFLSWLRRQGGSPAATLLPVSLGGGAAVRLVALVPQVGRPVRISCSELPRHGPAWLHENSAVLFVRIELVASA